MNSFQCERNDSIEVSKRYAAFTLTILSLMVLIGCGADTEASPASNVSRSSETELKDEKSKPTKKLTRLFWQNRDDGMIGAADLVSSGDKFEIKTMEVSGLNKLDVNRHNFVQMVLKNGVLVVGVRDQAGGMDSSGWVEIDTGVEEENHGDHSHWYYLGPPKLQMKTLDRSQGNPAHVYGYGDHVFIANDRKNGFTMIEPKKGGSIAKFFRGGGGHITLAVVDGKVGYSTWISRKGENAGRVDVVDLNGDSQELKYHFRLPSGGIHGATACNSRVFFAPSDGVCWVDCDLDLSENSSSVAVHKLALGGGSKHVYRTGAFESFENYVLCIGNCKGQPPILCLIDSSNAEPKVSRFRYSKIPTGVKLSTARFARIGGKPFAFTFAEGSAIAEKLLVFQLDSNGDGKLGDMKLFKSIEVGKSKIEGHFGHHGITILEDQSLAIFSNPGDGTISVLSLKDWSVVKTFSVGGQPTRILCYGGKP